MRAYFKRLGWELLRNTEVQHSQLSGEPPENWKVWVPDYEGYPGLIHFNSLSDLHEHWEKVGKMRVGFDNRERLFKELYVASDLVFRSTFKRWTEIGGRLPGEALLVIEDESCPSDWSERVTHLDHQLLLPRGELGEWDELRRRLNDFIVFEERLCLSQSVPSSSQSRQPSKRL